MPRPTPVRAPATRDQADAYRFGLRRLEAALVRGDPVPLHEQIRSQRRAALAGVALGLLGLCGAALYSVLAPGPADWRNASVVEGTGSGSLYAVADERLVPVPNLTAARLVLAATGASDAAGATVVEVPDADLAAAQRAAAPSVTGAVGVQPAATVAPSWALCDETTPDGIRTTLIGGAAPVAANAAADGVLLADPDGETWLVAAGRRHLVDGADAVLATLGRSRTSPRPASTDLLALLPLGPDLATPTVPGRGDRAPEGLPGRVGDVLAARVAGGGGGVEHFVVLRGGLQPVPGVAAELLRVASGAREPREVGADLLADARISDDLDLAGWPAVAPRLLDPAQASTVCWTWSLADEPSGQVWIGAGLPLPAGVRPVALASTDGPGGRVDAVAVGAGGAVLATGSAALPDADRSDSDRSDSDGSAAGRSDSSDPSDSDRSVPDRPGLDGSDSDRPALGSRDSDRAAIDPDRTADQGDDPDRATGPGRGGGAERDSGSDRTAPTDQASGDGTRTAGHLTTASGSGMDGVRSIASRADIRGIAGEAESRGTAALEDPDSRGSSRDDGGSGGSAGDAGTRGTGQGSSGSGSGGTAPDRDVDTRGTGPDGDVDTRGTGPDGDVDTRGTAPDGDTDSRGTAPRGGSADDAGRADAGAGSRADADADGRDGDDGSSTGRIAPSGDPGPQSAPVRDGQVWLISDTGVAYPVADEATARALGIATVEPAPAALLELLPPGPLLDLAATAAALGINR